MTDDPLKKLESELASFQPAHLSRAISDRISDHLDWSLADRLLAATMMCGSLAACIIVALVTWQLLAPVPSAPSIQPQLAASPPTLGQYRQALASADDSLSYLTK
jgi:hypothetical protein